MPNWCWTQISLIGPKDQIKAFDQAYGEAKKKASIQTDFGESWLGHMLSYLGYSEDQIINGNIRCRGNITYYQADDDVIILDTETAWAPMMKPIVLFKDKYAPDCDITYTAEEPGGGLYESNDPDVYGKYVLDFYGYEPPNCLYFEYPVSKRDLFEALLRSFDIEENYCVYDEADDYSKALFENILAEAQKKYYFSANLYEEVQL